MARVLLVFAVFIAFVMCLVIAFVVAAETGWERAGHAPWPENLGRLEDVPKLYPAQAETEAAAHLAELARGLGLDLRSQEPGAANEALDAAGTWIESEYATPTPEITAPPAAVSVYLERYAPTLHAIRDWLITRGRDIRWRVAIETPAANPNGLAHRELAHAFAVRALVLARQHDAQAWRELQAASELSAVLLRAPGFSSRGDALTIAKVVNGLSWKCPLPAPAWLAEARAVDHRASIMTGFRNDTWLYWRNLPHLFGGSLALHRRETARQVAAVTECAFDEMVFSERRAAAAPWWNPIAGKIPTENTWRRTMRYQAEREAAANALRVRAGEPIETRSRCSDGTWTLDGAMLEFSLDIPMTNGMPMPLRLKELR